ncbi:hypothetical protein LIER_24839 [Lithospermum erythrorhizon]|uniref:Retrotransposon gag domain-containing protein n=1 Tax=Lithospermum erythrorhizon TaxID=34254 RepID=A0AAV3R699_LITER
MNSNGNDDRPQGNDALNLKSSAAGQNEDALSNVQEPVHVAPVFSRLPSSRENQSREKHIEEFQSQMLFQHQCSKVYCRVFPSSLAGHALRCFNHLPEGCITSFEELKNRFTRTFVGRVREDKDEHSLMIIKKKENKTISSFQDRFQTEFNLVPGADQKIAVIAFVEGLMMIKFKESLLKKRPLNLEEVNECAYKYIRIEEAKKRVEKRRGERPMEEAREMSSRTEETKHRGQDSGAG